MPDELLLHDGGLLFVDGGLTTDPDCCCYYQPPPECPPCCVRIDWGTFNVDGDLYDQYEVGGVAIDVKVVMPVKNSRIVCNNQQITVEWSVDDTPSDRGSWIRFGAAWEFMGETPTVGADGETYEYGLVDWVGTIASEYSVSLRLRECFLDTADHNAFLIVGTDFPDWEVDIEVSRCPKIDRCCDVSPECTDCCAILDLLDFAVFEDKFYIIQNSVDPQERIWTGVLEITLPPQSQGKICEGEAMILKLSLIPPRHGDIENNTILEWDDPWDLGQSSPAFNPVDGQSVDGLLDWGTLTDTVYEATLDVDCLNIPCPGELGFPTVTIRNAQFGFSANINFIECSMDGCCPTVCEYVTGIHATGVSSIATAVDDEGEECAVDQHWGAGGGNAFIHPRVGGVMEYGCLSANWITVRCSTIAEPGGPDGAEATFSTSFEIAEGACLSQMKLVGEFSADNYVKEGQWKVNGIDQTHIPHGSFNETTTLGCIEFEISHIQGDLKIGTNTIEITVKNGFVGSGNFGGPIGLLLSYACALVVPDPE